MMNNNNNNETIKVRKNKSAKQKNEIWNLFDTEIKEKDPLVCLYTQEGRSDTCHQCEAMLAYSEEGFLTCTNINCGIIYKDILDQGAEWRYYGAEDTQSCDPTRCGMPINPHLRESSFGCKVLCTASSQYEMRKIRRYTDWQSMPYKEKAQYDEFQIITIMAQNNGIPKLIIDDAIRYHKKISEHNITFRGDNRDGIIAASIYISCRLNKFPRTAKEISHIFNLDVTSATKGCKNAMSIINVIEGDMVNNDKTDLCKTRPEDFIERYSSKLNINTELTQFAKFISMKIEKENWMPENTPHSIASGVIFFISVVFRLNVNKHDIKNVSDISEVTINKCYKKIEKRSKDLLPQALLKKYKVDGN